VALADFEVDMERLRAVCERFGVARLEVFGSFGRGESTAESDVDLLYELAPGARLGWDIEALAEELGAVIGRRVDLVARSALNERLRASVLADARPLYAA
jgi:predicted nucleotidyltransferase